MRLTRQRLRSESKNMRSMTARRNLVLQLDRSPDADRPVMVAAGYSIRTLASLRKEIPVPYWASRALHAARYGSDQHTEKRRRAYAACAAQCMRSASDKSGKPRRCDLRTTQLMTRTRRQAGHWDERDRRPVAERVERPSHPESSQVRLAKSRHR